MTQCALTQYPASHLFIPGTFGETLFTQAFLDRVAAIETRIATIYSSLSTDEETAAMAGNVTSQFVNGDRDLKATLTALATQVKDGVTAEKTRAEGAEAAIDQAATDATILMRDKILTEQLRATGAEAGLNDNLRAMHDAVSGATTDERARAVGMEGQITAVIDSMNILEEPDLYRQKLLSYTTNADGMRVYTLDYEARPNSLTLYIGDRIANFGSYVVSGTTLTMLCRLPDNMGVWVYYLKRS